MVTETEADIQALLIQSQSCWKIERDVMRRMLDKKNCRVLRPCRLEEMEHQS